MNFYNAHKNRIVPWVTLLAFVVTIVFNGLAGAGILNGIGTGEVSDQRPNKFVPSGATFSIWSLIYIALGLYCVWSVTPWAYGNETVVDRVGLLLALNFLFNTIWIICWQWSQFEISIVFMAGILGTLIAIYLRVGIDYKRNQGNKLSHSDKTLVQIFHYWVLQFPFSIYLGWISVASIANVAATVVGANPNFMPVVGTNSGWSAGMQTVASLLALAMLYRNSDCVYSSVIVWALFGIRDKHNTDDVVYTAATVLACQLIVIICLKALQLVYLYVQRKRHPLAGAQKHVDEGKVLPADKQEDYGTKGPVDIEAGSPKKRRKRRSKKTQQDNDDSDSS